MEDICVLVEGEREREREGYISTYVVRNTRTCRFLGAIELLEERKKKERNPRKTRALKYGGENDPLFDGDPV